MPGKTAEEFTADGYFVSGDLGKFDEDGYLAIVGRAKDLIISGGYNVYPKEVEIEIDLIPGVLESAVVGLPHPDFGEGVVAVVVPVADGAAPEKEIMSVLKERLAGYKLPKKIFCVSELPRNTMGKVQKNLLRERYIGEFRP
jgi:malonyl-CoA/methylmalonyl-CoA synthetase